MADFFSGGGTTAKMHDRHHHHPQLDADQQQQQQPEHRHPTTPLEAVLYITFIVAIVSIYVWCCKPQIPDERYHYREQQRRRELEKEQARRVPPEVRAKQVAASLECGHVVSHDEHGNPMLQRETMNVDDLLQHEKEDDIINQKLYRTTPSQEIEMTDMSTSCSVEGTDPEHGEEEPKRDDADPTNGNTDETNTNVNINDDSTCVICLDTFDVHDVVCWAVHSDCQHVFHRDCLLPWLHERQHDDCPSCRQCLIIPNQEPVTTTTTVGGLLRIVHGLVARTTQNHSYEPIAEEHEDDDGVDDGVDDGDEESHPQEHHRPKDDGGDVDDMESNNNANNNSTVASEALAYSISMTRTRSTRRSSVRASFTSSNSNNMPHLVPLPLVRSRSVNA